jgi:3-deoxy-D-manno-octulosonate 8-phosphate phosphatase (KDO 8-P phosphatase)
MKSQALVNSAEMRKKLSQIKLIILDVDGVLTDGRIYWLSDQGWTRSYHTQDGYGIRLMMRNGIQVAVFSGSDSLDIRERMKILNITHTYLGSEDKIKALEDVIQKTGLSPEQMLFIGDDLFDIPVLEKVGFSATVPHAPSAVKKRVDYVTEAPGGFGAVRELIEALRQVQGIGPYLD